MNLNVKKIASALLSYINKLLPKYNRVIVQGFPNSESSAIAVANYIDEHYDIPVYYGIHNRQNDDPGRLLLPGVSTIINYGLTWSSFNYLFTYMTSRYIFYTHGSILQFFSDRQTVTNIWHGVLYKKVGLLNDAAPPLTDLVVGTSQPTKEMFSKAFGLSEESVFVSGYPRNDMLLKAKKNKGELKKSMDDFRSFEKVAIWMPTYRKSVRWEDYEDGVEVGNPFYIRDFNITYFNEVLKENNTLCLVKPHPYAPSYKNAESISNVNFIDNEWISCQGISLYQLLGCTDVLISDVSSVIIDYMLLDQPVICISEDFEEYRETRGFYFDDIENWIPSRINTNQEDFFTHLKDVLSNNSDPMREKREELKNYFFDAHDAYSAERLVKYVLQNEN